MSRWSIQLRKPGSHHDGLKIDYESERDFVFGIFLLLEKGYDIIITDELTGQARPITQEDLKVT